MALTQVTGPYPIFTDLDGTPLDDGYLYIGDTNDDPETNPIQVYWDSALTIPASQPIRTNNGYAWRNGTPGLIYTAGAFSITIRNKRNEFVLYSPVGYGFDPAAVSASVVKNDFTGDGVEVDFTLSASPSTKLATSVFINGVYQEKDSYSILGNVLTFSVAPPLSSSIEVMTNETGVIGTTNASLVTYTASLPGSVSQTVQTKLEQTVSVKDFGAVGDGVTDDTAAIQAALGSGAAGVEVIGDCLVSASLSVPDGVRVFGNGYGSRVFAATAINIFVPGNNTLIENLRISSSYGDVAPFGSGNGIYIDASDNVEVRRCYIDGHGACGVQVRGAANGSRIVDNLFVGNIGGSGGTIASTNSDICLYSSVSSGSVAHIITGNLCLSDNSQAIILSTLSGNSEIVCANNVCITCDSALAVNATPTWRRHGIVTNYNGGNPSRLSVDSNIIRNTNWSGIYIQSNAAVSGPTIIQGNMISRTGIGNYPVSGSLSGGILFSGLDDGVQISNNTIEDHQQVNTGAINIAAAYSASQQRRMLLSSNVIKNSLGFGIRVAGYSNSIHIDGNYIYGSVKNDIYCAMGSNTYDLGVWDILNNKVIRSDALYNPIWLDDANNIIVFNVCNNTLEGTDNTTNASVNSGIRTRNLVLLKSTIKGNYIKKFYRGLDHGNYMAAGTRYFSEICIDNNVFDSCAIGIGLSSTANTTTVPVEGNRFLNCSADVGLSALTGVACLYVAKRNRTTLEVESAASLTTGTWIQGDRSWNTAVAAAGTPGWICTTGGTSGTWKAMAAVAV